MGLVGVLKATWLNHSEHPRHFESNWSIGWAWRIHPEQLASGPAIRSAQGNVEPDHD